MAGLTFQDVIQTLNRYWAEQGCVLIQPLDTEVGAGTFHPATFLRAIGPEPWAAAYVQPSRRPTDGRYGENPNRLQHYYQYQVVMKPNPDDILDRYIGSLKALGVDPLVHDLRFVEDNWESPTLGAWGLGWEVWLNGMEVTQFTYFQQAGGLECKPVTGEITYGLERLAMYLQNVDNVFDLVWTNAPHGVVTYGDVFHQNEVEQSTYNFEHANVEALLRWFDVCEGEAKNLVEARPAAAGVRAGHEGEPHVQPARRAPRDQRDRTSALHPARAHALARGRRGVLRAAREARLSGTQAAKGSRVSAATSKRPLLIELGTEELPPKSLDELARAFAAGIADGLVKRGIEADVANAKTYCSPRRLAVLVPNVATSQPDQATERRGPALNVGLDAKASRPRR